MPDWEAIRERLAEARRRTEGAAPDDEAVRAILEERARRLARVPTAAAADEEQATQLVVLSFGGERWGIEASLVIEVARRREVTRVPGLPPQFAGVTLHRGEILPVVDLRGLLSLQAEAPAERLVILGGSRPSLGLLAESVNEMASVRLDRLHPPPPGGREGLPLLGIVAGALRGDAEGALAVLDGAALLADERLRVGNE